MLVYTRLLNSNFKSNLYLKVVANHTRICPQGGVIQTYWTMLESRPSDQIIL